MAKAIYSMENLNMHTKQCQECNSTFQSPNSRRKFCSKSCSAKRSNQERAYFYNKDKPRCKCCDKEILRPSPSKTKKFCSHQCMGEFTRRNRHEIECQTCKKHFTVNPASESRRKFCSRKCMGAAMKYRKIKLSPQYRSFGECAIVCLLKKNYPTLKIITTDRVQLDGYELDIWLPDINVGIEYNGQHHYKPVYGNERFEKTKLADITKRNIALTKHIKIVTIVAPKTSRAKANIKNVFKQCMSDISILPVPTVFEFNDDEVLAEQGKSKIFGTGFWKGKKMPDIMRRNMSDSRRKIYHLLSPNNETITVPNLKEFCKVNSMQYTWAITQFKQNKPCKGWKMIPIT